MERMKDGDIISFNGTAYRFCIGGTCIQCSLRNTRLCDHLKCFNGEHFEVLKDVNVFEMPSEEEIETMVQDSTHEITCGGHDRVYAADGQGKILDNITYEEVADIIRNTIEQLKSKIIK